MNAHPTPEELLAKVKNLEQENQAMRTAIDDVLREFHHDTYAVNADMSNALERLEIAVSSPSV